VQFTVVTMTRGDAHKIVEWIDFHARLGFEDFQIVLDGDVDGTEDVLRSLLTRASITVHRKAEVGDYYDGVDPTERARLVEEWRQEHAEARASGAMRGHDPLAWRQHLYFPEVMAPYQAGERGRGWLTLIDVDEFLVLRGGATLHSLTADQTVPRLRFLNFNVDTDGYDPARPVLEQHTMRWSREDVLNHPDQRWGRRVKSLVRYRKAQLNATVHKISRGRHEVVDPDVGRIHHFKMPTGGVDLPYTVHDPIGPA
jgi:hypothetical protein